MEIFTTCERCGNKASIYIKGVDMGNTGLDPKHYGALEPENKVTLAIAGRDIFVKALCADCMDKLTEFLTSDTIVKHEKVQKGIDNLKKEKEKKEAKELEEKKKEIKKDTDAGKIRNFRPDITIKQMNWIENHRHSSTQALFAGSGNKGFAFSSRTKIMDYLQSKYGIETIWDLVMAPKLPTPTDMMDDDICSNNVAYNFRKLLTELGIQIPENGTKKTGQQLSIDKKKKNHEFLITRSRIQLNNKQVARYNKVITQNVLPPIIVGRIRQYGIQTFMDMILYQPTAKGLMAFKDINELSVLKLFKLMCSEGIMTCKDENDIYSYEYIIFYDEATDHYYTTHVQKVDKKEAAV